MNFAAKALNFDDASSNISLNAPITINVDGFVQLLNDENFNVIIVDCRFNYEYKGGHIKKAFNIPFSTENGKQFYESLTALCKMSNNNKKNVIVFYCEFSSVRGPKTLNQFREYDRQQNAHVYPNLTYPNIYLLEGGYCNIYNKNITLTTGEYTCMRDDDATIVQEITINRKRNIDHRRFVPNDLY